MKNLLPIAIFFLVSCGSEPMKSGATDSLITKETQLNSDSAKIPADPIKKIDYYVNDINNSFLNGNLKRKDYDGESPGVDGTLYAYYQNDSMPAYIYTEQGGEFRSEQIIYYLKDDKLIFVTMKNNKFGTDAAGLISPQIRHVESERHVYFDGDAILKDTTLMSDGEWFKENYDFIKILMTAKKDLKKAVVTSPR
ncbi:MAG TPA: hypothetical protein VL651_00575 [Bacteroidia bacterium]|nr:hypothetical protein [Bacteroidia bacterium]